MELFIIFIKLGDQVTDNTPTYTMAGYIPILLLVALCAQANSQSFAGCFRNDATLLCTGTDWFGGYHILALNLLIIIFDVCSLIGNAYKNP